MRNTITRSFVKNSCTCTVYNNGKLSDEIVLIPCGYNDNAAAERYIKRHDLTNGKLVEVSKIDKLSELYGMEEADFIRLATVVDERNKTTRDSITKTIKSYAATLTYMTADRKIADIEIAIPASLGKREYNTYIHGITPNGGKPIEVKDKHEVEKIYALSESDFIANARPMVDHFHYKF